MVYSKEKGRRKNTGSIDRKTMELTVQMLYNNQQILNIKTQPI